MLASPGFSVAGQAVECYSGVVDPAGCARVAVADWMQAAEKAAQDENSSKMQWP